MTQTLAQRLRAETKDAHVAAERSGVMASLLRGTITRAAYIELLENLAEIYRALEEELDRHAGREALAGIDLHALRRLGSLELDISTLQDGHTSLGVLKPATREYVARLRALGDSSPDLLLAHAYVRYMGDLSGGLILEGIVAKALNLEEGAGTTFYDFPSIPDADAFKGAFRDSLNAAAGVVESPDAIVREAQLGFALHERLFQELK